MRAYLSADQCAKRWPRLLAASCWAAILTHNEAAACLRDHHQGLAYSGEAVTHFGGCVAVLRAAIQGRRWGLQHRHHLRQLEGRA